jgi:hypothetical protein
VTSTRRDVEWFLPEIARLGEEIVDYVSGLGATLAITPVHIVLIREGAHFRPRTGMRMWPFDAVDRVRLTPPTHGAGRIVLRVGPPPGRALSLFVAAGEWAAAERVVGQIHARRRVGETDG